jgi:hypothetical protein
MPCDTAFSTAPSVTPFFTAFRTAFSIFLTALVCFLATVQSSEAKIYLQLGIVHVHFPFVAGFAQGRDTGAREMGDMRWGMVGFGSSGPDPSVLYVAGLWAPGEIRLTTGCRVSQSSPGGGQRHRMHSLQRGLIVLDVANGVGLNKASPRRYRLHALTHLGDTLADFPMPI